jgi:catechol 2,3-dioxygenase-like lactoylglutathione lyase family enzyme
MSEDFNSRVRNLSGSARWLIATAAILVFLGFATICSTFWMFTSVILTDSCAQLPQWMGFYLVLPPAFLAVGALLPPILFATRKNLTLVMGLSSVKVFVMSTVRYLVADVQKAIDFYTGMLGFEVGENWGSAFATVSKDDLTVWMSGPETSAAKAMPDGRVPEPGGWNRLVLEVDGLDELVETLRSAGTVFRNEIVEGPGGRQILIDDPSGNPIELFDAG